MISLMIGAEETTIPLGEVGAFTAAFAHFAALADERDETAYSQLFAVPTAVLRDLVLTADEWTSVRAQAVAFLAVYGETRELSAHEAWVLGQLAHGEPETEPLAPEPPDEVDAKAVEKYSEDQARDDHGRWSSGGGAETRTTIPITVRTGRTISTQTRQLVQQAVEQVVAQYPGIIPFVKGVEFAQVSPGGQLANGTVAAYYFHERTITANARVWSDPTLLSNAHDESDDTKGFSAVPTPTGSIQHEMGHAAENAIGREAAGAFRQAWRPAMEQASKYAQSGVHEAFAETFAAMMAGQRSPVISAMRTLLTPLKKGAA